MKAVVVRAPHAILQALGIYTFETRGFQPRTTLAPGDSLAIVLGRKTFTYDEWPEAWDRLAEEFRANGPDLPLFRTGRLLAGLFARGKVPGWPLGAVVAVVTYDGALPVVDEDDELPRDIGRHLSTGTDRDLRLWTPTPPVDGWQCFVSTNLADQLPLGDFTPGRYGWLMSSPRRLSIPVPCPAVAADGTRTVMQGVFTLPTAVAETVEQETGA